MTSKSLFSNLALVWESVKKKSWVTMIASVVFFFALPVVLIMSLQNYHNIASADFDDIMITFLRGFMGPYSAINLMIITILAFIAGIAFFAYIHSKRKVDFFHGLPITRTKLFLTNYFAGALSVLLPYIVFYLISVIILGGFGDLEYIRKVVLLQGLLVPIIYFFAVYSLTVLGGILTGNIILQGCAALYITFIAPGVLLTYNIYMDTFFVTYAGAGAGLGILAQYTSPVVNVAFSAGNSAYGLMAWGQIISLIFFGVLGLALGLFLYNKRPSEAAGKSVAFPWFGAVVKYPLIVLGSLCIALMFYQASPNSSMAWLVFGFIVGALLVSRIMEVIIAQDIKAIKKHWLNFGVSLVVIACIISVFVFDLTNYNQYVPASNKVETVNIEISGVNMYGEGYYSEGGLDIEYYSYYPLDDRTKLTTDENIAAALAIAKNGVENLDNQGYTREDYSTAKSIAEDDIYLTNEDVYVDDDITETALVNAVNKEAQCSVVIKYTLTSGRTVARMYDYVDKAATSQSVKTIVDSEEFKYNQLEYLDDNKLDIGSVVYLDTEFYIAPELLSRDNRQAIIDAYKTDVNNLTLDDMTTKKVVGYMGFIKYGVIEFNCDITAPIYETYENTLGVLAGLGYSIEDYGTIKPENVTSIKKIVYDYSDSEGNVTENKETPVDPLEYEEILNSTSSDSAALYNYFLIADENVSYVVEGKLDRNDYGFSLFRSVMDYWE